MDPGSSSCLFPTSPPPYNSMTVSFDQLKEETDTHNNDGGVPLCRVCERGYDGSQHFGVEVCRACAAFFRRAIEGRKKFVCRKGGDSCQLNAPRKVTCQKCRLTRCLAVGLQPDSLILRPEVERLPQSFTIHNYIPLVSASIGKGEALILEQRIGLPANRIDHNIEQKRKSQVSLPHLGSKGRLHREFGNNVHAAA
ncbi:hypothetical protein RB195_001763 [Necator americanus]|uniref:Nuclear receptor domain-containing protein n=1 Tax=Necator americanus TaxID=51031 RepID=A0ABR1DG12_NECAM